MNAGMLDTLRRWFVKYAKSFARAGQPLAPMKQLKLEHTLRTAKNARLIAEGEGWSDQDTILAEAVGILHDVGRFSQYRTYKTFSDKQSINHAEHGYEIMQQEQPLADWSEEAQYLISTGVRYHNCRDLPDVLEADALRFLHLVRDADKLDIIEVIDDALCNDKHSLYPEITLHVTIDGPMSANVLTALQAQNTIGYEEVKTLADFLGIQLSWMYCLQYSTSYRIAMERNLVSRIVKHVPPGTLSAEVCATIDEYMRRQAGGEGDRSSY